MKKEKIYLLSILSTARDDDDGKIPYQEYIPFMSFKDKAGAEEYVKKLSEDLSWETCVKDEDYTIKSYILL